MQNKIRLFLSLVLYTSICGCYTNDTPNNYNLTDSERGMCDTLQIDPSIIQDIRAHNNSKIDPFHYSLSKMFKDGKAIELEPTYLKGLIFNEQNSKSYNLVLNLKDNFRKKGYTIFLLENIFDIEKGWSYNIGVLKTTDKYSVLKQIATDGINYDITNDSLLTIIREFDEKYSLEVVGVSGDWCEFLINSEPNDWTAFAKEVYNVCPDVVDQGTGTIEALADEMKKTKRLYLWWD